MSQTEGATPIRAIPPDDAPMSCLTMSPRAAFAGVAVSALVAVAAGMYVSAVVGDPERSAAGAAPMVMVFLVALGTLTVAFLNLRWLLRNGVSFTTPVAPNEPERSAPVAKPTVAKPVAAKPVAAAEPAPARPATPTRAPASPTFSPVRHSTPAPAPAPDAPAAVGAAPAAAPAFEDPAPTSPVPVAPTPPAPQAPAAGPPVTLTPGPVAAAPVPVVEAPQSQAPQAGPLPSLPVVDARPAPTPQPEPQPQPQPQPEPEPELEADPEVQADAAPAGPRRVLRPQRVGRGTDRTSGPKGAKAAEGKAAPKRVAGRPRT